jgi:hypothetical protein
LGETVPIEDLEELLQAPAGPDGRQSGCIVAEVDGLLAVDALIRDREDIVGILQVRAPLSRVTAESRRDIEAGAIETADSISARLSSNREKLGEPNLV